MRGEIRPAKIRLEAMSVCQLRCPGCPTTTREIEPVITPGYVSAEQFERLLDENDFLREVELSNYGEILLNPELPAILEAAHRRGVALRADNGINLNSAAPELLDHLVRYGLRSATISIDGASAETYGRYRVGGDFHRVIENIRELNRIKEKHGTKLPRLTWQFVVFGHNEHEIEGATALAAELGMEFRPKLSWDESSPVRDRKAVRRLLPEGAASRGEYGEREGRHYARGHCYQLWNEPQVNWDGKVLGCCVNHWGEFGGNVFRDGLLECLNSEGMRRARAMLTGKAPPREGIPCSTCDLYRFMDDRKDWIREGEWKGRAGAVALLSRMSRLTALRPAVAWIRRLLRR